MEKKRKTLGIGGVPGWILCVGALGWPNECFWLGFGIGFERASSGSAGLVANAKTNTRTSDRPSQCSSTKDPARNSASFQCFSVFSVPYADLILYIKL